MTVIYLREFNCTRYAITFENIGCVRVQKFEDISEDEKNNLCVEPSRTILGKSEICKITKISGAYETKIFDGNTILLKISEENDKHSWVYIGGDKVCSFRTNDDIYKYISNMGNNLIPYIIATGDEYIFFSSPHFKYIERKIIKNDELLNTNEKCWSFWFACFTMWKKLVRKKKIYKFHANYN